MKRAIIKIWHIVKGASIIIFSLFLLPVAKIVLWKKRIWIITERPLEARDNGFVFYNYLLRNHPEINCYYAIRPCCEDFAKIKGKYLKFGSLKHIFYFVGCKHSISSTTECMAPNSYLLKFQNKIGYPHKNVFLQHGVIKDNLTFLYKKYNRIDLFICGAEPEYNDVSKNYGYKENEVAYTGLARFDNYFNINPKRQILVMPTWRRNADVDLKESHYFKAWTELLQSEQLNNFLIQNNIKLYFYMHPVFGKYIDLFESNSDMIVIANPKEYNVQTLLKESQVLITDYSSIFFDFGFMKKPAIYYQFDREYFFEQHYEKGYFSYENDSFGYIVNNLKEVIDKLSYIVSNDFVFEKKFILNHERFFTKYDSKNCERIYNEINNL